MILEKLLMPDAMFATFDEVTPDYLAAHGIRYIFSDIDNTLVTYDDPEPTEKVLAWLDSMEKAGIKVAFVSNNEEERVTRFNASLGYVARYKAHKPLLGKLRSAMHELGATPAESVLLGDQLLTDAAAGNRAKMYVIIVPPIKDVLTPFFRAKRQIEIPYINKFKKDHSIRF